MFHKMAQMIQMHTEKKLLDEVFATYRDVQDAAAEMAPGTSVPSMRKADHEDALAQQCSFPSGSGHHDL